MYVISLLYLSSLLSLSNRSQTPNILILCCLCSSNNSHIVAPCCNTRKIAFFYTCHPENKIFPTLTKNK